MALSLPQNIAGDGLMEHLQKAADGYVAMKILIRLRMAFASP